MELIRKNEIRAKEMQGRAIPSLFVRKGENIGTNHQREADRRKAQGVIQSRPGA